MTHQLRVTVGPAAGQVLPISAGYLYSIGRGAEAQLSIPQDTTLSRSHAQIYFDQANNAWLLKNESQHGTLLNGEVFNDHRYIQPGTSFQVGDSTVMFQVAGEAAPAGAPARAGAPASSCLDESSRPALPTSSPCPTD
ncbi:MAG: FHA domain-containing protein, partial [Planctomycetes bacterium]|nr:FHA domain-containing protein [Planctomycetota bacterium]